LIIETQKPRLFVNYLALSKNSEKHAYYAAF
jgi:hypothetical protein